MLFRSFLLLLQLFTSFFFVLLKIIFIKKVASRLCIWKIKTKKELKKTIKGCFQLVPFGKRQNSNGIDRPFFRCIKLSMG